MSGVTHRDESRARETVPVAVAAAAGLPQAAAVAAVLHRKRSGEDGTTA